MFVCVCLQVIFVDGNGQLHPRGFGLACHLGVLLDVPCVGVAKTLIHVDGIEESAAHKAKVVMKGFFSLLSVSSFGFVCLGQFLLYFLQFSFSFWVTVVLGIMILCRIYIYIYMLSQTVSEMVRVYSLIIFAKKRKKKLTQSKLTPPIFHSKVFTTRVSVDLF